MIVFRLDPIRPNDQSWQLSSEKNCVWTCARAPKEARDLVAAKTSFRSQITSESGITIRSPWQDEALTSCVPDPSLVNIDPGSVVRADGSVVDIQS